MVLSIEQEAIIVAFRRHTLLPLDDCLYALQSTIPHLTRSSLHRCFQRHNISRRPEVEDDKPKRSKFRSYPIGCFPIDIAEVRTEQGRLYMFVAIDRTRKFAVVELHEYAKTATARDFLHRLIAAVPYKIHTVLTDNGIHFTTPGAEAVLLRDPRSAARTPRQFRRSLRLRKAAEDPQRPHALRVHLQMLDTGSTPLHIRSAPSNPGTKHLSVTALSPRGQKEGPAVSPDRRAFSRDRAKRQ